MSITANQLKEIRQEFTKLKPSSVTLDGNRAMTVKQAIFTLAPTLERMKKRGFDTQEIVEKQEERHAPAVLPPGKRGLLNNRIITSICTAQKQVCHQAEYDAGCLLQTTTTRAAQSVALAQRLFFARHYSFRSSKVTSVSPVRANRSTSE